MSGSRETLLAGIDGGHTTTKAVLAQGDGAILATGTGPACDHLNTPGGLDRNRTAIHTALLDACTEASVPAGNLDAIGLGLTSAQRELDPVARISDLVREIASPETIWIDNDFASNLAGAAAGQPGIVVIAGGGSIGYGIDSSGREAISGGLGYLMGDEGSGWYFGIEALQAAARGADRRGPITALLPMILDAWQLSNIRECLQVLYREDFRRSEIAELAPEVFRVASNGDAVALDIVTSGAHSLARHALGVADQLHDKHEAIDVYPTGGVFNAGALILEPFCRIVRDSRRNARIHSPRFTPAIGALIRAAQQHGLTIDDAFLRRLDVTLADTAK